MKWGKSRMERVCNAVFFSDMDKLPAPARREVRAFRSEYARKGIRFPDAPDEDTLVVSYDGLWQADGAAGRLEQVTAGRLVPRLCVNNVSGDSYGAAIAAWQEQARAKLKRRRAPLDALARKNLSLLGGLEDTFEWLTGGVFFYDYEWFPIRHDPVKEVLEAVDPEGSTRYLLELDDKVLLRGPDIYYYYSCYISRYEKPTLPQIEIWFDNCERFLGALLPALDGYSARSSLSRRMLLAVADNLRNIILLMANSELLMKMGGVSGCTAVGPSLDWCARIDSYQDLIWSILDGGQPEQLVRQTADLARWVRTHLGLIRGRFQQIDDAFILAKCFNPLREVDNYFENYVVMQDVAAHLGREPLNLIGILYGGLELPFILRRIRADRAQDRIAMVFQNNGMYLDKQKKDPRFRYGNLAVDADARRVLAGGKNVLLDENIMSGLTMQLIVNDLAGHGIGIDKCAVIRHPCINRLEQILHYDTAVDIGLFGQFILGGLAATPYSKIRKGTNHADMFTDELYIFSVMTEVFLKGLYKNNSFIPDSEVDIFKGFSPGHSVPGTEKG